MNRSTDLQILRENPEAAGQVASAIRRGIVKGFLAIKNCDREASEAEIRRLYKIPDYMSATWLANGTLLFACTSETALVTEDGGIQRG